VQSILSVNQHLARVRIEGHADDAGDLSANQELSLRRARQAARWLIALGIAAQRLELAACGARYPGAPQVDRASGQNNRRVEFHVVEPAPAQPLAHTECELGALR
jgi:outer membrane protein OmpA-like peptidoglycan-associated protein